VPKNCQITVTSHGKLNVSHPAFGPRSSESADRPLCGVFQSHFCVNDDVIEVAIAVEIHWQSMSMGVIFAERLIVFILPGQFWAMNQKALTHAANNGTVKQLRLRECAGAWR
jgi:hypothetical protein